MPQIPRIILRNLSS